MLLHINVRRPVTLENMRRGGGHSVAKLKWGGKNRASVSAGSLRIGAFRVRCFCGRRCHRDKRQTRSRTFERLLRKFVLSDTLCPITSATDATATEMWLHNTCQWKPALLSNSLSPQWQDTGVFPGWWEGCVYVCVCVYVENLVVHWAHYEPSSACSPYIKLTSKRRHLHLGGKLRSLQGTSPFCSEYSRGNRIVKSALFFFFFSFANLT